MYDFDKLDPRSDDLPWTLHDESSYDEACAQAEVWITINNEYSRDRLVAALRYDKRTTTQSFRGRAIFRNTLDLGDGNVVVKGEHTCTHARTCGCYFSIDSCSTGRHMASFSNDQSLDILLCIHVCCHETNHQCLIMGKRLGQVRDHKIARVRLV